MKRDTDARLIMTKAFACYMQAAELGDGTGMTSVGECYEKGIGTEIDLKKAKEWYAKAADAGSVEAKEAYERLSTA
jgi:FOG: TPR repeat, SEL1 subfamily